MGSIRKATQFIKTKDTIQMKKLIYRCKKKNCKGLCEKPNELCAECLKKEKSDKNGRLWISQKTPKNTA